MVSNTILRYVVDDIANDLKQVFADKSIEKAQIAYWVMLVANRLKSQHIEKRSSGAYVHSFTGIPVQVVTTGTNPNNIAGRKRITLPSAIYDFHNDGGIDYISYYDEDAEDADCMERPEFTYVTFTRTTPKDSQRLYGDKFEKPSAKNPYFYRQGQYVYFLGIECADIETVEIGIYSTFDPLTEINLDDAFEFPEELLLILKRQVLDLGRFALRIPEDRMNDGTDSVNVQNVSEQKLVSVNDPINQQQVQE
jgi:hypothetical protein